MHRDEDESESKSNLKIAFSQRKGSNVSAIDGRKNSVTRDISQLEFSRDIRKRNQHIEEVLAKRAKE